MTFEDILAHTLKVEGGFVNHKNDKGGATAWGVTEGAARSYGYKGRMQDLPLSVAAEIYRKVYWNGPKFNEIGKISMPIAAELFDTYVNMGKGNVAELEGPEFWLQRWLNALNNEDKDWPELVVDGDLGQKTREALAAFIKKRGKAGETNLVKVLNDMQTARYLDIIEGRKKNEAFAYGWITNRV